MTGFDCAAPYQIGLFSRASGALICVFEDRLNANFTRTLDKTSQATITLQDSCCSCLPVAWAHEVAFYRADEDVPVWQGPVTSVTEPGREISVTANDKSVYWYKRSTIADLSHAGAPVDAATLFSELVAQAETGISSGLTFVPSGPTGVDVTRAIIANSKIGPILDDLANGAIDWTVRGLQAFAGGVTVEAGAPLALVTSDHWTEDRLPEVVNEGKSQVTRVIVRAAGSILGIYPAGPAVADPIFGILEVEIAKPQISSQSEADAYAKTYFERHQGPQIHVSTAQAALSKRFPYSFDDLICGRLFNVLVDTACTEQLLTLRLSQVSTQINEGHEASVKLDLQPVGTEVAA